MNRRAFATSILALGIGATTQPTDTWAAMGAHVAAPSFMTRSVAHAPLAAPSVRPFARQPVNNGIRAGLNGFRFSQFRGRHEPDFRRQAGFPFRWVHANGALYYLPYDYPPEYSSTDEIPYPPIQEVPQQTRPVVIHEPGCRTDTQKVPSEAGGETTINITRCY